MLHNISQSNPGQRAASTSSGVVLSFDLGGSHVAAMAARVSSPFNGTRASLALNEGGSATYLFDRVEEVGRMALAALASSDVIVGIAVAMPGPFDYSRGVSRGCNINSLLGIASMFVSILQFASRLTKRTSCSSTMQTPFFLVNFKSYSRPGQLELH